MQFHTSSWCGATQPGKVTPVRDDPFAVRHLAANYSAQSKTHNTSADLPLLTNSSYTAHLGTTFHYGTTIHDDRGNPPPPCLRKILKAKNGENLWFAKYSIKKSYRSKYSIQRTCARKSSPLLAYSIGGINQGANRERFDFVHDPLTFQRSLAQPQPSSPEGRAEETLGLQAECIAFLSNVKLRKYMYHCMG